MAPGTPAPTPAASFVSEGLFHDLMEVSLTAVNVLRPVYGPTGEIVDFTLDYLNPAAQRMSALPERPGGTLLSHRPGTATTGILDYYRRAFETGTTDVYEVNYQAEGLDNFFRLAARRSGEWLVVSFTDTADQPRTAVELALREAQAAEKAARADAEQQRNELREFVEQAPAAVAVYRGPEHRVELANATTLAIWDRALPDVLGRPVFDVLPEAATPDVRAIFERVFATGTPHTAIEQPTLIHRHGRQETVYWNFVFQPEYQPDGRISGIRSVGTDVTEQVRARQQLEQLNQELESRVQARTQEALALQADLLVAAEHQAQERETVFQVFAQTPACIALLRGPEHRFDYVNHAYQDLFPGRELVGYALAEALPDAADQGFVALLDGVYRTGETFFGNELPLAIAQPDGRPPRQAYFTFTYQVYRENGQVAGISIFAFDVAEQVQARLQREAERQRLEALFMQAPAAICILGGDQLVYELVNPGYQALFPDRRLLGRPLLDALPEIAGHAVHEGFRQVYETGVTLEAQALLIPLARPDDGVLEDRYFNYIQQARRDAQGRPDGVLVFAFEVTEQVQARQVAQAMTADLRVANEQLVRTNVDLDNFIYTASHDLKAPISNIEGLLDTLRDELPPLAAGGEVAYILNLIQDSVNRFTRTIEHLTDVSRLQKEHNQLLESVLLSGIIEDVRLDLAPLLQQTSGQLHVDVRAVLAVQFSVKNLRSVVYNLLSNALKYRHPERAPQVQVRAKEEGAYHVLEVQDNGLGLDLTREHGLFGMFRRYHTHVEGSGIGLYMVKRMVENTGGRIEVDSTLGKGSTFTVYFPLL